MQCPFCNALDTRVIDSRLAEEGDAIRRRRECTSCDARFTTYERAELRLPQIVKSDGRREDFNEAKLRAGLSRALEKRPVDVEQIEALVVKLRRNLMTTGKREVASRQLGEWVMEALKEVDQIAYVRFASVYRSFQDLEAFSQELSKLQNAPRAEVKRKQLTLIPADNK